MRLKNVTPILTVDAIEPALGFWVDRLGFKKATEVPHGGQLGFVILERDDVQIMYQTKKSLAADIGPLEHAPQRGSFLYIEVDDLDAVAKALDGISPLIPRRKTFYGADELIVREPAGNPVTFAQFAKP